MCYQKAPFRACGITRTPLALLWSGKQHRVNRPCLADSSGSVLALVHLPCYAWATNSVKLPPLALLPLKHIFLAYLIIVQPVHQWYLTPMSGDNSTIIKVEKVLPGFPGEDRMSGNEHWMSKKRCMFSAYLIYSLLVAAQQNHFVGGVTHLSGLSMNWLTLRPLLGNTTVHTFGRCHARLTLQNHVNHSVHNAKPVDNYSSTHMLGGQISG